jgi:hypothetical protein
LILNVKYGSCFDVIRHGIDNFALLIGSDDQIM